MDKLSTQALLRLMVFAIALLFLLPGLDIVGELVFDETHYVPAAKSLLSLTENRNPEHPLFAKEMIAAGLFLFGDNAYGWRLPGVMMSAFGLAASFEIALRTFSSVKLASLTVVLLFTSISFVVQARTAMLDTYTYPLLAISCALLMISAAPRRRFTTSTLLLILSGVCLGLATGAKWIAGIYAILALVFMIGQRIYRAFHDGRPVMHAFLGRGFSSWPKFSLITAGLLFGLPSLIAYIATYLPTLYLQRDPLNGIGGIIEFHLRMIELQTMPLAANSYESDWWSWPLLLKPIWYHFEATEGGGNRAIFYVGNPVIYWGGLIALLVCLVEGLRRKAAVPFRIGLAFLASWLTFAVLPKQIGFLFYYHGSAMIMCFVVAAAISLVPAGRVRTGLYWTTLVASTAVFAYFVPVIYALEMVEDQWLRYVWLPSWP